jgi:hypothetical protein
VVKVELHLNTNVKIQKPYSMWLMALRMVTLAKAAMNRRNIVPSHYLKKPIRELLLSKLKLLTPCIGSSNNNYRGLNQIIKANLSVTNIDTSFCIQISKFKAKIELVSVIGLIGKMMNVHFSY